MNVLTLVETLAKSAIMNGSFNPREWCIGAGPFNWVFRNKFPTDSGIYWFYVDKAIVLNADRTLNDKEVVYIGKASDIARRIFAHMGTSVKTERAIGEPPYGVGEGWEFSNGAFYKEHQERKTNLGYDLEFIKAGEVYVGWASLKPRITGVDNLRPLEKELLSTAFEKDGRLPLINMLG